jgi:hypothetical protein
MSSIGTAGVVLMHREFVARYAHPGGPPGGDSDDRRAGTAIHDEFRAVFRPMPPGYLAAGRR